MTKFVTNASGAIWWPNLEVMQPIQVPLKSILKYLTWIFLATEFASFVAGKIYQVIEANAWVRCASGNVYICKGLLCLFVAIGLLVFNIQQLPYKELQYFLKGEQFSFEKLTSKILISNAVLEVGCDECWTMCIGTVCTEQELKKRILHSCQALARTLSTSESPKT